VGFAVGVDVGSALGVCVRVCVAVVCGAVSCDVGVEVGVPSVVQEQSMYPVRKMAAVIFNALLMVSLPQNKIILIL